MGEVQSNIRLPDGSDIVDRRRGGPVGRGQRWLIALAHSRWIASLIVAFAVSWAFHQVEDIQDRKLEQQQRVIHCTLQGMATAQTLTYRRVDVGPILQRCEDREGK